jgi:hypothetical protein
MVKKIRTKVDIALENISKGILKEIWYQDLDPIQAAEYIVRVEKYVATLKEAVVDGTRKLAQDQD